MSLSGEDILFAVVIVVVIALVVIARRFSGAPLPLRQWADEHDCTIIRAIYREFANGPFAARGRHIAQDVYQISIRTSDGHERSAWVLCSFLGRSEPVEVVWDD